MTSPLGGSRRATFAPGRATPRYRRGHSRKECCAAGISHTAGARPPEPQAAQTTVCLPNELAEEAEPVARVQGSSVNQLIIDSLTVEMERVRSDEDFTSRAKRLIKRDKELLERLGK